MAGHSQFKNIMYRKGAQDKKRSKIFSKLSKEIIVAAKLGGADPDANPRLRLAIRNARSESMPKDNIERAIKRAVGGDSENYEEIRYEGFGPSGVGVLVECMTDNRNRTAAGVRAAFSKYGGNLGETGSVSFMFDHVGEIRYPLEVADENAVLEAALEAGAEDTLKDGDNHIIYCALSDLSSVSSVLEEHFGEPQSAGIMWRPQNSIEVPDNKAESLMKLLGALEDLDDVQNIYANYEVSEKALADLTSS